MKSRYLFPYLNNQLDRRGALCS